MTTGSRSAAGLRERLTSGTEDKLGKALAELIENPLISGTIGRAFDARERAAQAQELALSALNIPTAADIERLTRRLRSVSQRLEGIEDGVHRISRALADGSIERRLSAMEDQLKALSGKLVGETHKQTASSESSRVETPSAKASTKVAAAKPAASKVTSSKRATRKSAPSKTAPSKTAAAKTAPSKTAAAKTAPSKAAASKTAAAKTPGRRTAATKRSPAKTSKS